MKSRLLALLLLLLSTGHTYADGSSLVAVASSLRQVWPELMAEYPRLQKPRVTFGSSGNLARQITQGAPFELYLSADQSFAQWLFDNDTTQNLPKPYTQGTLAWVALPNSPLADWLSTLDPGYDADNAIPTQIKRLAIANPSFAPYGRAAKEMLQNTNSHLNIDFALGENAVQALQFALSGATDGGIVPLALVSDTARKKLPTMLVMPISATQYSPLVHSMVLIGKPTKDAQALFDFLLSEPAQNVFTQNGFIAVQ